MQKRMWNRILTLIRKEFLAVWIDKKSRFVLIVPPILQLVIFAVAATLDVKNVPIAIVNQDTGASSFELLQRFQGSPFFNKIVYLPTLKEATYFIENMKGAMVLALDEQFSKNLELKKQADILVILDGRRSNTTQIVLGYAATIVDQFNREFSKKIGMRQTNVELIPRYWFNPNLLYYWYNIPALTGILSMLVGFIVTALSVAREKELGTFDQLLVSPLTPIEILIGKTVPAIIIALIEGVIITIVGINLYGVPFQGSLILLLLSMFVFIFSIVGMGLFISAISHTQQQAVLGTFVFMTPSILLSGYATPIENMPIWLQKFTYLIPLRYYMINAKGLFLKDIPFEIAINNIWPMALIAVVTLFSAGWFFKSRLE